MRPSLRLFSILWIPLALLLTGCVSQTSAPRYFLLQATTTVVNYDGGPSIGLYPITMPEYLQRSALLVDSDDSQLRYSFDGRWGEPLADGIHRVSTLELSRLLGTGNLRRWPWSQKQKPDIEVAITVLALEPQDDTARLSAEVSIKDHRTSELHMQRFIRTWQTTIDEPTDSAIARAHSALVQAMNADIAAVINEV